MENGNLNWKDLALSVGAAVAAAWAWIFNAMHKKIDGKADKAAFDQLREQVEKHAITRESFEHHIASDERLFQRLIDESSIQRAHITKIFDKISEADDKNHDHFVELLKEIRKA